METYAFISRHKPTESQINIAGSRNIQLVHVGDRDAFTVDPSEFHQKYDGAVVVHPAAALRLLGTNWPVGVFNNINRAAVGEPPKFETTELHLYVPVGQLVASEETQPMCFSPE